MKKAYFAGGCYWGVQLYFSKMIGVQSTRVGFMGGDVERTSYVEVCSGTTGHAEVVEVIYDEAQSSFEDLILYFFRLHDPTTLNAQKNDIGTQYRSAIFTSDEAEKKIIRELIKKIDAKKIFDKKIVTTIEEVATFYEASEDHQDYLYKNPNGYNCHILAPSFDL